MNFLHLSNPPMSVCLIWDSWISLVYPARRMMVDQIVKEIVWLSWITRIDCIFNAIFLLAHALILKVDHLLLSWFLASAEGPKKKLEDPIASIRHSLEFLDPRVEDASGTSTSEDGQMQQVG